MVEGRERRRQQLTQGPIGAQLVRLATPMAIGIVAIAAFGVVDTWFVARLGALPLAAMGFAFPVMMVVASIAMGLGVGTTSVLARIMGAGDTGAARRIATDSLMLSVLVVGAVATAGLATIEPLFRALGAGPDTLPFIQDYMSVWYAGTVFLVVPMVGNAAIRATGDTRTPAVIMVGAGVLNASLDPLLIFGIGSFTGLGITGAALASVISRASTLLASLWILHRRERLLSWARPGLTSVLTSWRKVAAVGVPAALTNLAVPLALALLTRMVAGFGSTAVAAFGAAGRVVMLAMIPAMALAVGIAPFAGQNWGAGRVDRVRGGLRLATGFALAWGVGAWVVLASGRDLIATLFSSDPEVVAALSSVLLWATMGTGLVGVLQAAAGTLNAIGQPLWAASLNGIRVPLLLALPAIGGSMAGLPGLFIGISAADGASGALAWLIGRARLDPQNAGPGSGPTRTVDTVDSAVRDTTPLLESKVAAVR